ncbi:MAG: tetratricopeptide repeat protein [Candidatus Marinimicrobia bacterium]|nr:tetratricopeptide repeat protein [Candidatus Neomarinimicrobiota bacterium]MDP7121192.1 tetratricopeptide repeat protein [Candidatus Neomarinimicrobiota bacterium]MDP7483721.1 tetratricopeptide repeat protein [Candidatus Neomarinimicrobiota bacterium]MDP7528459.1 tetratricopeptide repeat protein [Candidatus Neomarinimicrobiota bacterium]MDP7716813.1 tetratricopeptide repeat protein [Candidatus Neomarinimicrobiota bacterium]
MRKTFVAILISLLSLFIVVTVLKRRSIHVITEDSNNTMTVVDKEKVQHFWEIYRQATEYRIAGNPGEAAVEYGRAIDLNGRHEDALYYLGNMKFELGEFEAAEQAWKRLIEVNPNSARAHYQLGTLYLSMESKDQFSLDEAEAKFQQALAINKEETTPLLRLGQVALIRGNLSQSQRLFDNVIASNYRSVEAHFLRGYIDWKKENLEGASTFLMKAVEYLKSPLSDQEFSGEGDTKTGTLAGLPRGPNWEGIFQAYMADLSKLDEIDLPREMHSRYEQLDEYIKQVRKKSLSATT